MTTQSQSPVIGIKDISIAGNVINKADTLLINESKDTSIFINQAVSPASNSPPLPASPLSNSLNQSAIPNELISEIQKMAVPEPKKGGEAGEDGV